MHGRLVIDAQPGLAAEMLGRQSAERVGEPAAEVPENEKAGDQEPGGGEILAAHDLAFFARLLAAIRRRFVCFIAKFVGSHGEGLGLVGRAGEGKCVHDGVNARL